MNCKGAGNVPYIVHPHAVVSLLKEWGYTEQDDPVTLSVAWGHDILEDTDTPESEILAVDKKLGERILAGVKMLTFRPERALSNAEYDRRKTEYIEKVAETAPPEIIAVKIADRLCNVADFGRCDYARTYYSLGQALYARIKDCKHARRMEASRRAVADALADFCQLDNARGNAAVFGC